MQITDQELNSWEEPSEILVSSDTIDWWSSLEKLEALLFSIPNSIEDFQEESTFKRS
jgi:hypothetical protein